jgi:DNA-binding NtrC family response regulator
VNERVLVVDDNPRVLKSILRALQVEGISCIGETDPRVAIETFRANPTDVVVVDLIYDATPDFTGLDVIDQIQRMKPFTRTILISGKIDHDTLDEESLASELQAKVRCNYYLPKSGSRDQLINTVREALSDIEIRATDWKAIAEEYVEWGQVTPEDVRAMNEEIKDHLIAAVDEERREE